MVGRDVMLITIFLNNTLNLWKARAYGCWLNRSGSDTNAYLPDHPALA